MVERYKERAIRLYFRGDAAFASPEIYDYLEAEGMLYAIRLPANKVLQGSIAHLLKRPVGRPPNDVRQYHASFSYRAKSWDKVRRVVAKVEWHPDELVPRVGFIVTNLSRSAELVTWFYNQRAKRSSTSRKARTRSNGRGCRAASSATTPSGSSFTRWPTTSATSCELWHYPRR